jgi:SAM-dependent methyltransferase
MLSAADRFNIRKLGRPSLDFGCMDGLNSYLLMGGKLKIGFDLFDEVAMEKRNLSKKHDYYDRVISGTKWSLAKPKNLFDFGLDWKKSHIQKSARFRAHRHFYHWTPGRPLKRFPSSSIGGIWAPNIYWIKNIKSLFREFNRIIKPGGRVIVLCPDKKLMSKTIYSQQKKLPKKWINKMDRGRHLNVSRYPFSHGKWSKFFNKSGFIIIRHKKIIPTHINSIYEVGFRPMFKPLIIMRRMLKKLGRKKFARIKLRWLERIHIFMDPFLGASPLGRRNAEFMWHIFELQSLKKHTAKKAENK